MKPEQTIRSSKKRAVGLRIGYRASQWPPWGDGPCAALAIDLVYPHVFAPLKLVIANVDRIAILYTSVTQGLLYT